MSLQILFSTRLKGYQPVIWYGKPIYEHYPKIKTILKDHLGEEYAELLAEPHINREARVGTGKAFWMSSWLQKGITSVSKTDKATRDSVITKLAEMIGVISHLAETLKRSDNHLIQEYSELVEMSHEIPGEEYIYFDREGRISLACWGFSSEEAEKEQFMLNKVLPAVVIPTLPEKLVEYNTEVEQSVVNSIKNPEAEYVAATKTTTQQSPHLNDSTMPPPPPRDGGRTKRLRFPWMWIAGIILIGIICWFLIDNFMRMEKASFSLNLPDIPMKFKPIDPGKIITNPDDPYKRKIISDRLNLVIKREVDVEKFAFKFLKDHKDDNIKVIFYDTLIRYVQLQVPANRRNGLKTKLKQMHPEIKLVWDEALFANSARSSDPDFNNKRNSKPYDVVKVFDAWDITMGDSNIVVAVIDDGFDLNHEELSDKIVNPWNVPAYNSNINTGMTNMFHGTHVATTAVGFADNGKGICGIAPNCKLMPIQVADSAGYMSFTSVITGILYAIAKDADVINMSLGMTISKQMQNIPLEEQKNMTQTLYPDEAEFWKDLFKYTDENNITIVIAAGNSNILSGIDPMQRSDDIIIVAALDTSGTKAPFSNYGEYTDVCAPGVDIYSAIPKNRYGYLDGTSMASPIVAGATALIKSVNPSLKNKQIKEILINTASKVTGPSNKNHIGPVINIWKALKEAAKVKNDTIN